MIVCGLILTLVGADYLLESVLNIFGRWGVSEVIIGLTIVALGTSLPELVTSIIASLRKESDVALGNVVGSNIYIDIYRDSDNIWQMCVAKTTTPTLQVTWQSLDARYVPIVD